MSHAWLGLQIAGLLAIAAALCLLTSWPWALLFAGVAAVAVGEVKS